MTTEQKTHNDYVDLIGGTHHTGRDKGERSWNAYYRRVYERTLTDLLAGGFALLGTQAAEHRMESGTTTGDARA